MWGELSWCELSLGRDVCNSPRHGLYVNSLLGLSIKPKVEIESRSTLDKFSFLKGGLAQLIAFKCINIHIYNQKVAEKRSVELRVI